MNVHLQVVKYIKQVYSSLRVQSDGGDVITELMERLDSLKYSH